MRHTSAQRVAEVMRRRNIFQEWIELKEDIFQQEVLTSSNEHEARPEVKDMGATYSDLQRMMGGYSIALEEQRPRNEQSRRTCLLSGANLDS